MLVESNNNKALEIARRNDIARKLSLGVMVTKKAADLPDLEGLLSTVRVYNNFTVKNDPYEAHDMGDFNWKGEKVIWKIDYYDPTLTCCVDPLDPDCKRIITVMLASEY
ncbi:MAG: DUF3768 domain-containing protein [Patescibacteria group bacterium]|jgi:hypothetical protein